MTSWFIARIPILRSSGRQQAQLKEPLTASESSLLVKMRPIHRVAVLFHVMEVQRNAMHTGRLFRQRCRTGETGASRCWAGCAWVRGSFATTFVAWRDDSVEFHRPHVRCGKVCRARAAFICRSPRSSQMSRACAKLASCFRRLRASSLRFAPSL